MSSNVIYPCHVLKRAVIYTQLLILSVAAVLAILLFDSPEQFFSLFSINFTVVIIGLAAGLACVAADLILMKLLPEKAFDDGGINQQLFQCLKPQQILLITLLIAFSEELLFRGVIQTQIGFIPASLIFIAVHVRYLKNIYLLINVTILSFLLGYVYEYTESLWSVFIIHFIIDYILGIYIHYSNKEGV
ncbi:CPBP family intramembrane glutamic endopeptidase [Jeotgalibacillus haloalkalitolerans]|uniref:CPBP family intramembrane glutamic endopeptidase n=1 Tax=Jeotgalibacillus haloalkalitolerans TaxID=3104292 RepID=A0ABU5KLC5_9BACL|nr:CPBP family intramembrane glutamic endopeptidase [Jeotgalibacillus sp. HH7-29]MDZ5712038.1 CPBP family intramembrane glutamic endopeptidase [Jeotgalibacillus sp. HH7-29]